jgi:hypothetical protein
MNHKEEIGYIREIHRRYVAMCKKNGIGHDDRTSTSMDLFYLNKQLKNDGRCIDLALLASADDFTFAHDIFGIKRNIVRSGSEDELGKLENCFLPRTVRKIA